MLWLLNIALLRACCALERLLGSAEKVTMTDQRRE